MTEDLKATVHMNLAAPLNSLLIALQKLLDTVKFLEAADFQDSRVAAYRWLANGFLRDAVEIVGGFLDDYIVICEIISQGLPAKKTSLQELETLVKAVKDEVRTFHFPRKLARLEKRFGLRGDLTEHVLSLNKARSCLVHRQGCVTVADANADGKLIMRWNTTELVAVGEETGTQLVIDRDGIVLPEASRMEMRFVDRERAYALGDRIELDSRDVYNSITDFLPLRSSIQPKHTRVRKRSRYRCTNEPLMSEQIAR